MASTLSSKGELTHVQISQWVWIVLRLGRSSRRKHRKWAYKVLLRFGNHTPEGLPCSEGPPGKADLAADAFQNTQSNPKLLGCHLRVADSAWLECRRHVSRSYSALVWGSTCLNCWLQRQALFLIVSYRSVWFWNGGKSTIISVRFKRTWCTMCPDIRACLSFAWQLQAYTAANSLKHSFLTQRLHQSCWTENALLSDSLRTITCIGTSNKPCSWRVSRVIWSTASRFLPALFGLCDKSCLLESPHVSLQSVCSWLFSIGRRWT